MLRAEIKQLRDEAIEKRDRLKTLRAAISEGVKAKQLHGLLKKVDECLSLKSGDAELETLREKLQAREEKNAAQVVNVIEKAQGLRKECRFKAASNALGKIPVELMTQEASDLLEDCDSLAGQRETAMRSLKSAMDSEEYESGLAKTKEYRDSLENSSLDDEEFSRAFAACQRALKEQQEAEETAERRRAVTIKLSFAAAAVTVVILLIAVGLGIKSSMNANARAEAEAAIRADSAVTRLDGSGRTVTRSGGLEGIPLSSGDDGGRSLFDQIDDGRAGDLPVAQHPEPKPKPQSSLTNSLGMAFKLLPGGTFTMGDANEYDDETPHQVTLTQAFELGVYEVTQEQYEAVMGTNPSHFKGPQNPVENVSWNDAVEFCRKLSAMPAEKSAGYVYRSPTEAEWEYACRAGTTTKYSFGDSDSELGDYAWYGNNSGDQQIDASNIWNTDQDNYFDRLLDNNCRTHPVGEKKPNAWGLYDMHGNVWEWCQDWYGDYPSGAVTDPTGSTSGDRRVLRGGSFVDRSSAVRSAYRFLNLPDLRSLSDGFRPARTYRLSP
jgi:formylglycine-generating enzyme required for sulfatase activity